MRNLPWFLLGVIGGFIAAHLMNKDPRGHEVLADVDARITEFTDRIGDAYREQEARMSGLVESALGAADDEVTSSPSAGPDTVDVAKDAVTDAVEAVKSAADDAFAAADPTVEDTHSVNTPADSTEPAVTKPTD